MRFLENPVRPLIESACKYSCFTFRERNIVTINLKFIMVFANHEKSIFTGIERRIDTIKHFLSDEYRSHGLSGRTII